VLHALKPIYKLVRRANHANSCEVVTKGQNEWDKSVARRGPCKGWDTTITELWKRFSTT